MTDEEWSKAILSEYDWQGAVVPLNQFQRGSDMSRFICARCNRSVSWEGGPRWTCSNCDTLRALLRKTIEDARRAL